MTKIEALELSVRQWEIIVHKAESGDTPQFIDHLKLEALREMDMEHRIPGSCFLCFAVSMCSQCPMFGHWPKLDEDSQEEWTASHCLEEGSGFRLLYFGTIEDSTRYVREAQKILAAMKKQLKQMEKTQEDEQ